MTLPTSLALSRCVIRADDVDPVVLVAHHPLIHVNDVVCVGDLEAGGGKINKQKFNSQHITSQNCRG